MTAYKQLGDRARNSGARRRSQPANDGELGHTDCDGREQGQLAATASGQGNTAHAATWSDCEWVQCSDGKSRPIEPGTFPLAHGLSGRVGRLRAYGNAIVPQVAAEVIRAFMDFEEWQGGLQNGTQI